MSVRRPRPDLQTNIADDCEQPRALTGERLWLVGQLRKRFPSDIAEDLAQEALLRAHRRGSTDDVIEPRSWLLTIAVNAWRELRRRAMVRAPDAVHGSAEEAPPNTSHAHQLDALLLKQIVLGLPPKLREVFVLSRFEGLTYPEIAQRCGISVKTVEWRMTKALDICSARLRD